MTERFFHSWFAVTVCGVSSGPEVPVPGVAYAVFSDQGRGQLRCHEQAEGTHANRTEHP